MRKAALTSVFVFLLLFISCGIISPGDSESTSSDTEIYSFSGSVIEVDNGSILVAPFENESIMNTSDKIMCHMGDVAADVKVGDSVTITYNGVILESYPAQISVITIKVNG